jgi:MscS family membrane protein
MSIVLLDIDWSFFKHEYMGETVANYLWFAGIVVFTILLKNPMALLLTRLSSLLTMRFSYVEHKGAIREILFKPMEKLVQVVLFFIAFNQVDGVLDRFSVHNTLGKIGKLNFTLGDVVNHIFLLVFIIFLTQFIARFIDFVYYIRIGIAQKEKNNARMQLLPLIKEMSKLILWIISCFWILGSVCHVNIPALITGLGIGGVAIALAGKETVENFFAAFTILSDKPFHTGDTIKLGEIEAVVERIGFRSTRLRNLDGSAYIIPNQNLVSQNLINMSMRVNRHVRIAVNIKYGLTHSGMTGLIEKLKEDIIKVPPVKEPVLVAIESFDKETFQLVITYNLPHPLPDNTSLIEIKRDVNLKVFEIVAASATIGATVGTS